MKIKTHKFGIKMSNFQGAFRYFLIGYAINLAKTLIGSFKRFSSLTFKKFLKLIVSRNNFLFALFFGAYVGIFRVNSLSNKNFGLQFYFLVNHLFTNEQIQRKEKLAYNSCWFSIRRYLHHQTKLTNDLYCCSNNISGEFCYVIVYKTNLVLEFSCFYRIILLKRRWKNFD